MEKRQKSKKIQSYTYKKALFVLLFFGLTHRKPFILGGLRNSVLLDPDAFDTIISCHDQENDCSQMSLSTIFWSINQTQILML